MILTGDFDFLQAKVHALRSRLYELDRLDKLCDLRTVAQLCHRLEPRAAVVGHHELQRRLLADHLATLDVLRQHLPRRLTPFATWMLRRFQLENLKVVLRARRTRQPFERVEPFLAPVPADLAMPWPALLKASSLADFLLIVPVPEFRKAGEQGAVHHAETGETFLVELAMEAAYYEGLLERLARLPSRHRRGCQDLVHLETHAHTLLCLFRVKLNYGLPLDEAGRFFVVAEPSPLPLERLYDYPAFDDMLERVPRRFLPREGAGGIRTVADLERALWARILQVANRQFYRSVADLGAIVAFYAIKRVELANLYRVIEGVRYGMAPAAIRAGLIRVDRVAAT